MKLEILKHKIANIFERRIFSPVVALMLSLVVVSCSNDDTPKPPKTDEPVGRTVLVYMLSASNGLGASAPADYDKKDIDEMCQAAEAGDIRDGRLLVFHSASNGNQVLKEILPSGLIDTLKIYDTTLVPQSSDRMNDVFEDMKSLAPAEDYGLVLWGHGTGWLQNGIMEVEPGISAQSYGWEHNSSQSMNVTTLANVLSEHDFSFLYMDCCYMASVEVAYQLRNSVRLVAAYPTEVLGWGMPYEKNVKCFFEAEPNLVQAAKNTFDYYNTMTDRRYRMCLVTVFDTSAMDRLADVTRRIYQQNSVGLPVGYIPQAYSTSSDCKYFDFGNYIENLNVDEALLAEFNSALDAVVLYEDATPQLWGTLDINHHSGLSTYILRNKKSSTNFNYNTLDWYKDVASALMEE